MSDPRPRQSDTMRAYLRAVEESRRACDARMALPPGSSRAKVTRLNARWMLLAEERDRLAAALSPEERVSVGLLP